MGCSPNKAANNVINPTQKTKILKDNFAIDQTNFVKEKDGNILNDYEFVKRLGEGGYGSVFLGLQKITKLQRAIKVIAKERVKDNLESLLNEINIQKKLDHPNIMKIYEYYQDQKSYYIVGELLEGGELFDYICDFGKCNEALACSIMTQIFSSLNYLHNLKIVHRDIKPENVMFVSKQLNNSSKQNDTVKLIDFGISTIVKEKEILTKKIGSPLYVAPEVLEGNYNEKCDIWSAGVILFTLLTGCPPFFAKGQSELIASIKSGNYKKELLESLNISKEAMNLIDNLLVLNYHNRLSAEKALSHNWFKKNLNEIQDEKSEKIIFDNLIKFRADRKIQIAVYYFFSYFFSIETNKKELIITFKKMDKNSDGTLSKEELLEGLKNEYPTNYKDYSEYIFQIADLNKNDKIDYSEFVAAAMEKEKVLHLTKIEQIFKIFDKNGDGSISLEEFKFLFKGEDKIDDQLWNEIFSQGDENNDKRITFAEFKSMMMKLLSKKT